MTDINSIGSRVSSPPATGAGPVPRGARPEVASATDVEPVSRIASGQPVDEKPQSDAVTGTQARREPAPGRGAERSLDDAVAQLNDYVQSVQRELQFSIDGDTGRSIVRVVDRKSQELIRQIPSDVALKLARQLEELQDPELFDARI